jgi:predicted amidophosphoribosyltransferase
MDILWQPEKGVCSHCGQKFEKVRRFTSEGHHVIFCWSCWSRAQTGSMDLAVGKKEWKDDVAMKFEFFGDDGKFESFHVLTWN